MARRRQSSSFQKILVSFFGAAFLLVALAVGYKVITEGSVLGTTSVVPSGISWEFNGKNKNDTEGWSGERLLSLQVLGGYLSAITNPSKGPPAQIKSKEIKDSLVGARKILRVRLSVSLPSNISAPVPGGKVKAVSTDQVVPQFTYEASATPARTGSEPGGVSLPCRYIGGFLPKSICQPPKITPTVTPKPRGVPYSFPVTYTVSSSSGKFIGDRPLVLSGVADGQMYEKSIVLPETDSLTVKKLQISFEGVPANTVVNIDWIRLNGGQVKPPTCQPRPSCLDTSPYCRIPEPMEGWCPPSSCIPLPPECSVSSSGGNNIICDPPPGKKYCPPPPVTPTPTITCKYGVNSFGVFDACGSALYRHAKYSCYGAIQGVLGTGNECLSSSNWSAQAKEACYKSTNCDITPTPTFTPTPKFCPSPAPCPVPYIYGDPGSGGCPIYFCPITPTPTSKSTSGGGVACTQEAKRCSNGTYVSRTGPNCEFAACPN